MYPITGIVCCARAASGHATAAPPRSVMKLRRFISITSSSHASGVDTESFLGMAIHRLRSPRQRGRRQ
jgi:hypothetical protein